MASRSNMPRSIGDQLAPVKGGAPVSLYDAMGGFGGSWAVRADGSGQPEKLFEGKIPPRLQSFSPDGRHLADVDNAFPDIWTCLWASPIRSTPRRGSRAVPGHSTGIARFLIRIALLEKIAEAGADR